MLLSYTNMMSMGSIMPTIGGMPTSGGMGGTNVFRDSDIDASLTKATEKVGAIQTVVDAKAAVDAAYTDFFVIAQAVTGPDDDRTAVDQAYNNYIKASDAARVAELDAAPIANAAQAAEDQAAADAANAADADDAYDAAQAAINTLNTAQAALDVATKTADVIANDITRYKVISFKKSFQDALCNASAATQVYSSYMSTNAKNMTNAISNVESAQAAVDVAKLAVDAATTADTYATQYSDFVAVIVNNPIQRSRMEEFMGMMGGGMAAMATTVQEPIINRRAFAKAKALLAATRAADVNSALQSATKYFNIATAAVTAATNNTNVSM